MLARTLSSFLEDRLYIVNFRQDLRDLLRRLMGNSRSVVVMMVMWVCSNVMVVVNRLARAGLW
jgi:hypothetical protein